MIRKEQREGAGYADPRMMVGQIVTVADLESFKQEIIEAVKELLENHAGVRANTWLKSHEVMKLLGVSANTLQGMRDKKVLPFSRIGGVFYYKQTDIEQMLDLHKSGAGFKK